MMRALDWAKAYWRLGGIRTPVPSALPTEIVLPKTGVEQTDAMTASLRALGEPPTFEGMLAFAAVWPLVETSVKWFARVCTRDPDDREDLVQEAMIALWHCDPTRYDFRNTKDVAYVRRILINRMHDVWEKEPGRFRSQNDGLVEEAVRRSVGGRDLMVAERMVVSHGLEE